MEKVYERPSFMSKAMNGFCPGCGHGTIHKFMAEAIEELGVKDKALMVYPVGCGGLGLFVMNRNAIGAAHGRAAAVATAVKRCNPEDIVISYQGDGDLAAIGMAETMHAANRGENITVIFVNNCNFGMTGGQMAPTTMEGQKTTTSQTGRDLKIHGSNFKMAELIATLDGPKYVARVALHDAKNAINAKKVIKKALERQVEGKGYSFIEVVSMCPTNWKMSPVNCVKYINDTVLKEYPLGTLKEE